MARSVPRSLNYHVIDDFMSPDLLEGVLEEWPDSGWYEKRVPTSYKRTISDWELMGPQTVAAFDELLSTDMLRYLESLLGIDKLYCDTDLRGGGLHEIPPGGFLKVHVDFNGYRGVRRAVNVLLYLNKGWQTEWGGQLELWSPDLETRIDKIEPVFNRAVIFETSDISYHGHPWPHSAPVPRKSLATYYYTAEPVEEWEWHNTIYREVDAR